MVFSFNNVGARFIEPKWFEANESAPFLICILYYNLLLIAQRHDATRFFCIFVGSQWVILSLHNSYRQARRLSYGGVYGVSPVVVQCVAFHPSYRGQAQGLPLRIISLSTDLIGESVNWRINQLVNLKIYQLIFYFLL